ncbi:MAG: arginine decarboxylase, pyruvoyl-dependent [Thermoplasmata archaeon]
MIRRKQIDNIPPPMVPRFVFFTKGWGRHKEMLMSFEVALRDAGIEKFNLVNVSSIFPPNAKIITKKRGLKMLKPGQIVHVVMSRCASNEPNRLIAASVGLAMPADKSHHGYLSEHHAFGQNEKQAGDYAEDLAAEMLATTLGIPFDINKSYDERKEIFKMDGRIVKTQNITQSAVCDKNGMWNSVLAAAVFVY